MIQIALTDEQKLKLKPLFDAATDAHNKSTEENNVRCAIHGQVWEQGDGYIQCRLFDPEQTKIIAAAILEAIEIDKRKASQARLVEIEKQLTVLAKERDGIKTKLVAPKPTKKKR